MGRSAVVALLLSLSSHSAKAELYQWTLSASATDPFVNTAAPTPGFQTLHLWFACSEVGAAFAEFGFEISPPEVLFVKLHSLGPHTFVPVGGGFFFVLLDCPMAPVRVAELWIIDNAGGFRACFAPSETLTLGTIDCAVNPALHPMAFVGFASDGTSPCTEGQCSGAVSVDGASWASVKALYRE